MKASDKKKFVIRNGHTKAQMREMEKRFVEHQGPYLTLQQALELAKTDGKGEANASLAPG